MSLEQVYRRERRRILSFIKSRIGNWEEAEDILQDVFFQAIRHLSVTQPIDNMLGWLYSIARNKIVDRYRARKDVVSLQAPKGDTTLESLLEDSGLSIEQGFRCSLVIEALIDCLEELPAEQREVVVLQAIEGRTFREISAESGVPINTLIARKRYALRFLRERLSEIRELLEEEDVI